MPPREPFIETYDVRRGWKGRFSVVGIALVLIVVIIGIFGSLFILSLGSPPETFPTNVAFEIKEGSTASDTATYLKEHNLIRSITYFKYLLRTEYQGSFIQAGRYIFEHPLSAGEIARAITQGEFTHPPLSVTFYEGVRGEQIVKILNDALPAGHAAFNKEAFDDHIGYLFPDTYFIKSDITQDELIKLMTDTFNEKTAYLDEDFASSTLTKDEIITLASIIEREANTDESMRIISGILQKRLKMGMALQADATLEYLLGKSSGELNDDDLTIDSPYNTYEYPGLPPTPIANPGLKAIEAALHPEETDYLYYLTGSDGEFHYAETFDQHKENKQRYLK